ncbi:MAG: phosphatase PAP2-related protein [archaeon]|nr:phosphatase PAP2-related protein [archaeon]
MKKDEIKEKFHAWRKEFGEHKKKIILAVIFLIIAFVLDYLSGIYVTKKGGVVASDLILDNIPPIDLSFLFVWLYLLVLSIIILYPFLVKPRRIHYIIGIFSSFVLTRSIFICFTHLKTPLEAIPANFPWILERLNFNNDLFFSAHTGLPFLGFLMFRKDNKVLAYFMLASSIVLGATVLLMHQHYSIDVFSAFFITYGVYKIGDLIFKKKD